MNLKKPKNKGSNDIGKIILPKIIDSSVSFISHQTIERGGFLYGIKEGGRVYIGSFSHCFPLEKREFKIDNFNIIGEGGEEYKKIHSKICHKGEKTFSNFVQIAYHSHPKLSLRDFTKKEKENLEEKYPGYNKNLEELVKLFDSNWLSEDDKDFARKYSSYGLSILSIGKDKDVRNIIPFNNLKLSGFLTLITGMKYLFGKEESRLHGFQVNKNKNVFEIPIIIAEKSGDYLDEKKCLQIMENMQPLSLMVREYYKEYSEKYKSKFPKYAQKVNFLLKGSSLDIKMKKYKLHNFS